MASVCSNFFGLSSPEEAKQTVAVERIEGFCCRDWDRCLLRKICLVNGEATVLVGEGAHPLIAMGKDPTSHISNRGTNCEETIVDKTRRVGAALLKVSTFVVSVECLMEFTFCGYSSAFWFVVVDYRIGSQRERNAKGDVVVVVIIGCQQKKTILVQSALLSIMHFFLLLACFATSRGSWRGAHAASHHQPHYHDCSSQMIDPSM